MSEEKTSVDQYEVLIEQYKETITNQNAELETALRNELVLWRIVGGNLLQQQQAREQQG